MGLSEIREEAAAGYDASLFNSDLAPIPLERRTWQTYNYASLWVAMSVCIPTYMLASGLIAGGNGLGAGDLHHLARQCDRPHPDGP